MAEPRLQNFEVFEPIGRGGMGVIHRGVQRSLGRTVAIKRMHAHLAADPAFVSRFESEARTAATLEHPNVVRVIDFGREGSECFIAMEFVDGPDLRTLLERQGKLPPEAALSIALDLVRALAAAHEAGVVHRDVKPANVLLARDGTAKLADFSIARAADIPSLTEPGRAIGTPAYMSPEQSTGRALGPPSDVFSAGVVLYELLAGRPPFEGDSYAEVARRITTETPRPIEGLSPGLARVVEHALAREPERRTPDARALLRELEDAATSERPSREAVAAAVRRFMAAPPPAERVSTRAVDPAEVMPGAAKRLPWRPPPKRLLAAGAAALALAAAALGARDLRHRAQVHRADAAATALDAAIASHSPAGDLESLALRLLGEDPANPELAFSVGASLATVDDPNARLLALQQFRHAADAGVHADDARIVALALRVLETTPPDPGASPPGANEVAQELLRSRYPAARRIWAEGAISGSGPALLSAAAVLDEAGDPRARQPWLVALRDCASGDAGRFEAGKTVLLETDDAAPLSRVAATLRAIADAPAAQRTRAQLDELLPRLDERIRVQQGGTPSPNAPAYAPILSTGNPFFFPVPRDQNLACYALAGSDPKKCDGISDKDGKQICLAVAGEDAAACDPIQKPDLALACAGLAVAAPKKCAGISDANLRAFCEGVASHDPSRCTVGDSDTQHLCYALSTHVPSNCRVVHSIDDRAFCVAVSNRDTVLCGPIRR